MRPSYLIALLSLVAFVNPVAADWFNDFDDQLVPDSWQVLPHPFENAGSDTFSTNASSGYLTVSEERSFDQGGTPVLRALNTSEMFNDVRVSATVNLDASVGTLFGLTTENESGEAYLFGIEMAPTANRGTAWIARAGRAGVAEWGSLRDYGISTRLDIDSSYSMEMDVIEDEVIGRIFDTSSGTLLMSMSQAMPNPILDPKIAGVYTATGMQGIATGGTFDDITASHLSKALMAGDADQDLDFDQLDLVQVQTAAKYVTNESATWGEGDWNGAPGGSPGDPPAGDGIFNQFDIIAAQQGAAYLTGPYAVVQAGGTVGDGQTSVVYNTGTGELAVDAPAGLELTSINIDSTAGIFTGEASQNLGGSFDNDADANIFKATFGSSFGSLSFGNVARAGLSQEFVLDDLSVIGSLAGGGDLGEVDLVYVPEPTSVLLLTVGLAIGLMHFRRVYR